MRLIIVVPTVTAALFLLLGLWRWRAAPDAYSEAHRLAAARAVTSRSAEADVGHKPVP